MSDKPTTTMTAGELARWCARLGRCPPSLVAHLEGGPHRVDEVTVVEEAMPGRTVLIRSTGVGLYVPASTTIELGARQ